VLIIYLDHDSRHGSIDLPSHLAEPALFNTLNAGLHGLSSYKVYPTSLLPN